MLQALINLFKGKKTEQAQAECPFKVEAPAAEPVVPPTSTVQVEDAPKPAKKTAAKKPAVKAKTARNKKK